MRQKQEEGTFKPFRQKASLFGEPISTADLCIANAKKQADGADGKKK